MVESDKSHKECVKNNPEFQQVQDYAFEIVANLNKLVFNRGGRFNFTEGEMGLIRKSKLQKNPDNLEVLDFEYPDQDERNKMRIDVKASIQPPNKQRSTILITFYNDRVSLSFTPDSSLGINAPVAFGIVEEGGFGDFHKTDLDPSNEENEIPYSDFNAFKQGDLVVKTLNAFGIANMQPTELSKP